MGLTVKIDSLGGKMRKGKKENGKEKQSGSQLRRTVLESQMSAPFWASLQQVAMIMVRAIFWHVN